MDLRRPASAVFKSAFDFRGEASRSEFWLYLIAYLCGLVITATLSGTVAFAFFLVLLIPFLAVCVRRLHNAGFSGWVLLIGIVPILGQLVLAWVLLLSGSSRKGEYYTTLGTVLGSMIRRVLQGVLGGVLGGVQGARRGARTGQRINTAIVNIAPSPRCLDCHGETENMAFGAYYCHWCDKTWSR